jgi:hypothetical protein
MKRSNHSLSKRCRPLRSISNSRDKWKNLFRARKAFVLGVVLLLRQAQLLLKLAFALSGNSGITSLPQMF